MIKIVKKLALLNLSAKKNHSSNGLNGNCPIDGERGVKRGKKLIVFSEKNKKVNQSGTSLIPRNCFRSE